MEEGDMRQIAAFINDAMSSCKNGSELRKIAESVTRLTE
jgi:glycine/serine hydroxymethyltransferase